MNKMFDVQYRFRKRRHWKTFQSVTDFANAKAMLIRLTHQGYWAPRYGRILQDGKVIATVDGGTPLSKLVEGRELLFQEPPIISSEGSK
ncbi:MAG: hypothetical protein ISN29_00640 [Gammaproteobacteria bacterium AqS3]|nr:hypothetical protein [Gammaproteobacteria bacterium AqS3]